MGVWKSKDSKITLSDKGETRIEATASFRGNAMKTDVKGTWLANDDHLHMTRKDPLGKDFTVSYQYELNGDLLSLSRKETKTVQEFKRVKP